jgi:hypothetical protein
MPAMCIICWNLAHHCELSPIEGGLYKNTGISNKQCGLLRIRNVPRKEDSQSHC